MAATAFMRADLGMQEVRPGSRAHHAVVADILAYVLCGGLGSGTRILALHLQPVGSIAGTSGSKRSSPGCRGLHGRLRPQTGRAPDRREGHRSRRLRVPGKGVGGSHQAAAPPRRTEAWVPGIGAGWWTRSMSASPGRAATAKLRCGPTAGYTPPASFTKNRTPASAKTWWARPGSRRRNRLREEGERPPRRSQ